MPSDPPPAAAPEMTPLSADEIEGLRALRAAATPGPWKAMKGVEPADDLRCGVSAVRGKLHYLLATIENGAPGDFCDTEFANAAFIVGMENAFDTLLSTATELERLTRERDEAREALTLLCRAADPFCQGDGRHLTEQALLDLEHSNRAARATLAGGAK